MRPYRTPAQNRAGFTLVELAVGLVILLVSLLIFSSAISGITEQRAIDRENALAAEAARNMLERLRSEDFGEVYALFNADPTDDPGVAGSAPGNRFEVAGLDASTDAVGVPVGEIRFPSVEDPLAGWQLREDLENRALGLPRDISGDSVVDGQDHSDSYFILPVQIRVRWSGPGGVRQYEMSTQLCRFNRV
jgi:prepilin-type N-terminal cleavage/methylation domain-containing protein